MDQYPSLNQNVASAIPEGMTPVGVSIKSNAGLGKAPRFAADDGAKSLAAMAVRDLDVTLQLLAERARYITGASGAAIALRHGEEMVCRASAGASAPGVGTRLAVSSGLSGESVRTRQILRCDDAQSDERVNRASCESLGIASALVMPLLRQQEVIGVFEVLSGRAYAFEERDITALQRLGEMIHTAVDHAEAARRVGREIGGEELSAPAPGTAPEFEALSAATASIKRGNAALAAEAQNLQTLLAEHGEVGTCERCGFPVSGGRQLCLDCETSLGPSPETHAGPAIRGHAEPLLEISPVRGAERRSWLQSHKYLLGTLVVAAVTVAVAVWFR